ncbi:hypothetical protein GCM10009733_088780 [Nonomuraea maheshkhaliensis]|uniref:Uncharacterized protein n=1 Tax=Nonomuraea maheshkhaliensis TaxID=419590 RepID=A0ABN2GWU7_9ACTN
MEDLPSAAEEHARPLGLSETVMYVTDPRQSRLVPLPGRQDQDDAPLKPVRIGGTLPGRAFRAVELAPARSPATPAE